MNVCLISLLRVFSLCLLLPAVGAVRITLLLGLIHVYVERVQTYSGGFIKSVIQNQS